MILRKKKVGIRRGGSRRFSHLYVLLFSVLLASVLVVQKHIVFSGKVVDPINLNYITAFSYRDIGVFIYTVVAIWILSSLLIHAIPKVLVCIFEGVKERIKIKRLKGKTIWLGSFLMVFVLWSVFWLTFFPGTGNSDNVRILNNPIYYSAQHTFFYNMLLSGLFQIGSMFSGNTGGAALNSFFQIIYCASIVACLIRWLYEKQCPLIFVIGIQFFFSFAPEVANIALVGVKDVIFSFTLLLFIPWLYDAVESNGEILKDTKYCLKFVFASAMTIWIRNNGLYVMVAITLAILICLKRRWKQHLCLFLVAVCVPATIDKMIMKYVVDSDKQIVEQLAVPIQQIAMTLESNGNITEEQWVVIDNIMPREEIIARYAPSSVDALKWGEGGKYMNKTYIENNLGLVLKTWAQMLPSNLSHYIRAYLLLTHGYWAWGVPSKIQAFYYSYINVDGIDIKIDPVQVWPDSIQNTLTAYYKTHTDYQCVGTIFWIILFLLLYTLCNNNKKKAILFVPVLAVWFTLMISVPINTCFRYNYSLFLYLPFLLCLTLWNGEQNQKEVIRNA